MNIQLLYLPREEEGGGGNMVILYMGCMRRYCFEQIGVWKSESSFKNR